MPNIIGTAPNQVPTNADLGTMAFQDSNAINVGSASNSGNLTFTGTGNRITGDFSNATVANRVMFENSTANAATSVGAKPSGTGAYGALFSAYSTTDVANAVVGQFYSEPNGTGVSLRSVVTGTAPYAPLTFYTGGSERMRIDSSGNVGIGTSSPATKLNVANGAIRLTDSYEIGWGANTAYLSGNSSSNTLLFYTSNTERMRIDSSGNLLVGTTSFSYFPTQGVTLAGGTLGAIGVGHATGTGSGNGYINFTYGGTGIGSISQNGTTAVAYNTSSDYRLKENIQPMQNALDVVAQLNPVTYTWKADGSDGQGFIAHELQAVVPDCVTGEKDAVDAEGNPVYQGIDTSFLVATLTKAIQEQQEQIEQLKAEVAALKGN